MDSIILLKTFTMTTELDKHKVLEHGFWGPFHESLVNGSIRKTSFLTCRLVFHKPWKLYSNARNGWKRKMWNRNTLTFVGISFQQLSFFIGEVIEHFKTMVHLLNL